MRANAEKQKSDWAKVGSCLYRYRRATYYALFKLGGKQIRLFTFDNCKKGIEAACKRLGYPHFTLRSLRRMFITRALMRGVDVQTVSRWQGHVDGGALLLRTYAHVLGREHSQRMASLMGDEPENVVPNTEATEKA